MLGGQPVVERKRPAMEPVFAAKIDEFVDRSSGRIRADVAHEKLVAIGYQGSGRTTRRWVAESKRRWRQRHGRRTRPWIPEPGLWMQWDVRHEALRSRMEVEDHHRLAVAAAGLKLRAVRPGRRRGGRQAALTTRGLVGTARRPGPGKRDRKVYVYRLTSRYVDFMWPLAQRVRRIPKIGKPLNWRLLVADYSRHAMTSRRQSGRCDDGAASWDLPPM